MRYAGYLCVYLAVLFQLGCSLGQPTRPSEFYVLSANAGTTVKALPASMRLGVGPVTLPDVYDRPQIVTRPEINRISLDEFNRWGGDLRDNLRRVIAGNLAVSLDTDEIVLFPWPASASPDLQLSIAFQRFDGTLEGPVMIEGVWAILDGARGCQISRKRFSISEATAGEDYRAYVQAISNALSTLARDMAARVANTRPGCPD